jgi:DNA-binding LacI/PurR family transcriptional regulator
VAPRPWSGEKISELSPGHAYVIEVDNYLPQYGIEIFDRLCAHAPANTVFVFLADLVALPFLAVAQQTGVRLRDRQIRVTGFDNTFAADWFGLSSVDYQLEVVGRVAYQQLQLALEKHNAMYSREVVPTVAKIRKSS